MLTFPYFYPVLILLDLDTIKFFKSILRRICCLANGCNRL